MTEYINSAKPTPRLDNWNRVASLLGDDMKKTLWVTSHEWGVIAKELEGMDVIDPNQPNVKPDPRNFKAMKLGTMLTLKNAGTEDQEIVNNMNLIMFGEADYKKFVFRKTNFQTGRA